MLEEKKDTICSEEDFITGLGAKIIETGESECIEKIYPSNRFYKIIAKILSVCLTVCGVAFLIVGIEAFAYGVETLFQLCAGRLTEIPQDTRIIALYCSWIMFITTILLFVSIFPCVATQTGEKRIYTCIGDKNVLDELGKSFECINIKGPNCKVFRSKRVTAKMDDKAIWCMIQYDVVMWLWTAYCYDVLGLQNLGAKVIVPAGIIGAVIASKVVHRYCQWCSQMVKKEVRNNVVRSFTCTQ